MKCSLCFEEAVRRVSAMMKEPAEKPKDEVRDHFWLSCYNQTLDVEPKV
jgi:hypothetical protein